MTDDPLYGDRPKPPIVPMSSEQVVGFDLLRTATTATPLKRRWPWVLALLVGLGALGVSLAAYSNSVRAQPHVVTQRADTPAQALHVICRDFSTVERSYATHAIDETALKTKLASLQQTEVAFSSPGIDRFESDLTTITQQLATYDTITGAALKDLHRVCGV